MSDVALKAQIAVRALGRMILGKRLNQPPPSHEKMVAPEAKRQRRRKQFYLSLLLLFLLMILFAFKAFAPKNLALSALTPLLGGALLGSAFVAGVQWLTVKRLKPSRKVGPFWYIWPAVIAFFSIVFTGLGIQRGSLPNWEYATYTVVLLLAIIGLMDSVWNVSVREPRAQRKFEPEEGAQVGAEAQAPSPEN